MRPFRSVCSEVRYLLLTDSVQTLMNNENCVGSTVKPIRALNVKLSAKILVVRYDVDLVCNKMLLLLCSWRQ